MINVLDYIKLIMEKKKWTQAKLVEELNRIEKIIGDNKTQKQQVSEYLNGVFPFRPKILIKWELALGLKEGTLANMVSPPMTKEGKEELKKTIENIRKARKEL